MKRIVVTVVNARASHEAVPVPVMTGRFSMMAIAVSVHMKLKENTGFLPWLSSLLRL